MKRERGTHRAENPKAPRERYEKPRLRAIDLAAEEVLASGCKMAAAGLTGIGQPDFCGFSNGCAQYGS